jgi:hypothetical protein
MVAAAALRALSVGCASRVVRAGHSRREEPITDNARSAINRQRAQRNYPTREAQFVIHPHPRGRRRILMNDIDREGTEGDDDEQFEQMIVENSILLHSLAALLVRKGVIKQEEIDAEMDKLYDEMEKFDGE